MPVRNGQSKEEFIEVVQLKTLDEKDAERAWRKVYPTLPKLAHDATAEEIVTWCNNTTIAWRAELEKQGIEVVSTISIQETRARFFGYEY